MRQGKGIKMQLGWLPSLFLYIGGILLLCTSFKSALKAKVQLNQYPWKKEIYEEHTMQFVRNKPLDPSLFIEVALPRIQSVDHEICRKQYLALMQLASLPMVYLKNTSNKQLKQMYGPQIIESVSMYERHYFQFMQAAIDYAERLLEHGYTKECESILQECIRCHCDFSKCYLMLGSIYKSENNYEGLEMLRTAAAREMEQSPFLHKIMKQLNDDSKASV